MIRLLFNVHKTQTCFITHYFYFERAASSGGFKIWNLIFCCCFEIGVTVQKKIAWITLFIVHLKIKCFHIAEKKIVRISGVKRRSCCFLEQMFDFRQHGSVQTFFFFFFSKHFWGRIIPPDGQASHGCCDLQSQFQITWCGFKSNEVEFDVQALHRDETCLAVDVS